MSRRDEAAGLTRWRTLASRIIRRVGGMPAVRLLSAVLKTFDTAGGGLVAGGLAYAALVALLPLLLLLLSVMGLLIDDATVRENIVTAVGKAVPPLEGIARTALEQVAAGAASTGVVALLGLLWGSSRFYGALDAAFARIFHAAPRRNAVQRTVRGMVVTALFVAAPLVALVAGSAMSWLVDLAPVGVRLDALVRLVWTILSPLASFILFVALAAGIYRFVPTVHVSVRALSWPAATAGLVLAAFTQAFAYIAPRLVGTAAVYGTFVTGFALLAWLSFGFNVLLLGGAWTRVRVQGGVLAVADALAPAPGAGPAAPAGEPDELGD